MGPFDEGRRHGACLAALLASVAWATSASAQTGAESPGAPVVSADGESLIGEIVVTARKRSERLRDVPMAIKAVTGEQMAESNITQLVSLYAKVPNLTVSYGTSQPLTLMRGLGSGANLSFDQAVGKFIDYVSYGRDQDARLPLFDLERVEVLRGPQVLVFGNSSTAGALNLATRRPGSVFGADMSAAYEFKARETNLQGGVTLPVNDQVALRLAGIYQDLEKGWVRDLGTGDTGPRSHNYAGRATLRLAPTDSLEVLLKAEYDHVADKGSALQPYAQSVNPPDLFTEIAANSVRDVNNRLSPFQRTDFAEVENETYQSDINYEILGGTLTSTTAYRDERIIYSLDGDGSPRSVFNVGVNQHYRQFSQELRFHGVSGPLDYTVGAYYQDDHLHVFGTQDFNLAALGRPLPAFSRLSLFDEKTEIRSAFADLSYHLSSALTLEGGVRYTNTQRVADQAALAMRVIPGSFGDISEAQALAAVDPSFNGILSGGLGVIPHRFTGITLDETHWQPQVVAKYEIAPRNMIYAKYVQGAKAGGVDYIYGGSNPDAAKFKPEKATSYELGVKGLLFNGTLDYAVDVFSTTFQNLQVSVFNGVSSFLVSNAGEARARGAEFELSWAPIHGLLIDASGAYLDSTYVHFAGAACTFAQTAATPAGSVCRQDLSGARTPYASRWAGTLGVSYRHAVGGGYTLTEGASVNGRSSYNAGTANNPRELEKGYVQFDAHLDLKPEDGAWSLSLFGRNLTNEQYADIRTTNAPNTGGQTLTLSRGRQVGLRWGMKY